MTAGDETRVALRHLATGAEYEQCLELQRLTWGEDFRELVPPAILKISQKVGGIVAGAFDEEGRMLGFVFGISGVRDGRLSHWSHMLAVLPEARGLGLGKRLKLFQRSELLRLGVEIMYWTYDPLVARNANLNLNRLGARPQEYVRDMYGGDTGSDVHSGLGTDRFVVAWELAGTDVTARLAGAQDPQRGEHERPVEEIEESLVLNPGGEERQPRTPIGETGGAAPPERVYVEIPVDIDSEKARSADAAQAWRRSSREGIERALAAGFEVSGFVFARLSGTASRCFYRLDRTEA